MDEKILGYEWADIQRAQHGGRLSRAIDTSRPSAPDAIDESDLAMLVEHGADGLRERGYWGVIDRLTRAAVLGGDCHD